MREIAHAQKRNPYPIWMKFCRMVDIHGVITYENFGDDRLRGLGVAGGQILAFFIDFDRRPYNTLVWKHDVVQSNRKYITCRIAVRGRLCKRQQVTGTEKLVKFWRVLDYASGQTDKQTDGHADHNTSHLCQGRSNQRRSQVTMKDMKTTSSESTRDTLVAVLVER